MIFDVFTSRDCPLGIARARDTRTQRPLYCLFQQAVYDQARIAYERQQTIERAAKWPRFDEPTGVNDSVRRQHWRFRQSYSLI